MNTPRPEIPGVYSLTACATRVGVSPGRLAKVWKTWSVERRFPAPFGRPPLANYAWDAAAVDAWVQARSGALGEPPMRAAANDEFHVGRLGPRAKARVDRERHELARMMGVR